MNITDCFVSFEDSNDVGWLLNRAPLANGKQIESFLEKVAIVWADMGVDEDVAREAAFTELFHYEKY